TQQKTVKLGFGKRKCAFQFNRVLCSNYQERLRKRHSGTLYSHLPLGHRLKQCRLGSGSGPIDLVYQKNLRKERDLPEKKFVTALIEVTDTSDICGKQIGRSVHALERCTLRTG